MALNPPMGSARTYVRTDGPLSYDSWIEGILKGHTFISTYPLLEFSVNGKQAGDTIGLAPGKAKLHVLARAQSLEPYEKLEIIVNGKAIRQVAPSGDHYTASVDETIEVDRGGGVAAPAPGPKNVSLRGTWGERALVVHSDP